MLLVSCYPTLLRRYLLLLALDPFKQLVEGVRELCDALIQQLLSHLLVVNTNLLKLWEDGPCFLEILFDTHAHFTMIAQFLEGFKRHGINRVRADQFLSVEHIAVGWILRAGAGPQWSLHVGTCLL